MKFWIFKILWLTLLLETLRRVNETTSKSKEILKKAAEAREHHEKSLEQTKELNKKWKEFQDSFDRMVGKLCEKIESSLSGSAIV